MHSIDSSSDTRAALPSGAPSGSRAALHSGDPIVGGAGLGPAGPTDAAVGAHNVYLRTPSAPPAGRRDSQVFEGHGIPSAAAEGAASSHWGSPLVKTSAPPAAPPLQVHDLAVSGFSGGSNVPADTEEMVRRMMAEHAQATDARIFVLTDRIASRDEQVAHPNCVCSA